MRSKTGAGRTFLLAAAFAAVALAGAWLGLVAAVAADMVLSGPARFPGEDLAAVIAAAVAIAAAYALVRRAVGRLAALNLLFVAAYAALDLLCSLYLFAPREFLCFVPPPEAEADVGANVLLAAHQEEAVPDCRASAPPLLSPKIAAAMPPAAMVTVLLCGAEVRRSALLRSAGLAAGSLFALAGLVLSLARALA